MSIRLSAAPLIAGAVVVGGPGLGVLAEAVPSTGESGPGYIFDQLAFPADTGKEVRGLVTVWPTLGTLTAYEDSSFVYDGSSDNFTYQLYVDGVARGVPIVVTLGAGAVTLTPSLYSDADTFFAATVTVDGGPQALSPALYFDADSFFSPTVTPGTVTLTPSLYVDADTFFAAEVAAGSVDQTLLPSLYLGADSFFAPTVAHYLLGLTRADTYATLTRADTYATLTRTL